MAGNLVSGIFHTLKYIISTFSRHHFLKIGTFLVSRNEIFNLSSYLIILSFHFAGAIYTVPVVLYEIGAFPSHTCYACSYFWYYHIHLNAYSRPSFFLTLSPSGFWTSQVTRVVHSPTRFLPDFLSRIGFSNPIARLYRTK